MVILAVDLAAKYSAACLMGDDGTVLDQSDSWNISEDEFIWDLTRFWEGGRVRPEVMVVEDLPHKLPYTTLIKTVCRLQGRIVEAMQARWGYGDQVLFLAPAEWRKTFKGLERGTGPLAVVPVAQGQGYVPPDLSDRAKGIKGGAAIGRKVATDYCSAFLIGRWAVATRKQFGTYDVVGTSRYSTKVIRKKDADAKDS